MRRVAYAATASPCRRCIAFSHCREQKVDVTIYTKRHGVVRVEDAEESLYASIDIVTDKVRMRTSQRLETGVMSQL